MRYLSIDLEATGLEEDAFIIEFAMVPFDSKTKTIEESMAKQFYVHCPPYENLEKNLNKWVKVNNKELIIKANEQGVLLDDFRQIMDEYVHSKVVKDYFGDEKIVLFGKSMNAIDIPFLNRDLGWDWMNDHFHHRILDLSSFCLGLIDMGRLPEGMDSGSNLMNFLGMGEVCHTALEDAVHTAEMYLKLLTKFQSE